MYIVTAEAPESKDSQALLSELSTALEKMNGSSGDASFDVADLQDERSLFVVARDNEGAAQGCGAIKSIDERTGEIKRMYARSATFGVGRQVLAKLESEAKALGYGKLVLETRKVNVRAVSFYIRNGYSIIPNFGRYVGNDLAVCFSKSLEA